MVSRCCVLSLLPTPPTLKDEHAGGSCWPTLIKIVADTNISWGSPPPPIYIAGGTVLLLNRVGETTYIVRRAVCPHCHHLSLNTHMLLTTGLIVLRVSLCSKYPIPNTCPLLYCALYCIVYHIVSNCWRYLDPQQCCWPPSSLCWSSWLSTCQCRDEENYNQRYHNIPINFSLRARVQKEEHQIFEKSEGCNHLESLNQHLCEE